MSTRALLIFQSRDNTVCLYKHGDGYPDQLYGVINSLSNSLHFSWETPRMETDDYCAAVCCYYKNFVKDNYEKMCGVVKNKTHGGGIYVIETLEAFKSLDGFDLDYVYLIEANEKLKGWVVEVYRSGFNDKTVPDFIAEVSTIEDMRNFDWSKFRTKNYLSSWLLKSNQEPKEIKRKEG